MMNISLKNNKVQMLSTHWWHLVETILWCT